MNEKLFVTTVDGGTKVTVLPLNGSAALFPKPWEDLSHLVNILELPEHSGSSVEPLYIDLGYINKILRKNDPDLKKEAALAAVLSGDTAVDTAITVESSVKARRVKFNLGLTTQMFAALIDDASKIGKIPTRRLLIITDLPRN